MQAFPVQELREPACQALAAQFPVRAPQAQGFPGPEVRVPVPPGQELSPQVLPQLLSFPQQRKIPPPLASPQQQSSPALQPESWWKSRFRRENK